MKIIILVILGIIVASLGSALYHLLMDKERTQKTIRALTWRVILSLCLFMLLLLAFASGLIQPHGLKGESRQASDSRSRPNP